MTKALWKVAPDIEKNIIYCDSCGRLDIAAVAASPNGRELQEIIESGIKVEVLQWQMDVQDPSAAGIISRALNKGHEVALRTTEISLLRL